MPGAGDEPAADRIKDLRKDFASGRIKKREAHFIRMNFRDDVAAEVDIACRVKIDLSAAGELQPLCRLYACNRRIRLVGISLVRGETQQPEDRRLVGAVADAGKRERPVKIDLDPRRAVERARFFRFVEKANANAHRPDRVRRRRADTDFEYVEYAQH